MNALQQFIHARRDCGFFVTEEDLPALIAIDRLCSLYVRLGSGARFTCAAQNLAHLLKCVQAGGDYTRDVSFPVGAMERAACWAPEPPMPELRAAVAEVFQPQPKAPLRARIHDHKGDCGGVIDANGHVWSETELGGAPGF